MSISIRFHQVHNMTSVCVLLGIPIPGSRSTARVDENAHSAEIQLTPEAIREIRALTEAAEVQGDRYPFTVEQSSLPLAEWKGE